ncbi:hypothetical protein [Halopseudomonas xinjiangensis]|uniref:hypothetical protein n=1 Tax=Halopseudomonas xinjiangensis TaxID=487184 RepID=UPI000B8266C0|nr:hypothetical protein [Halopseudomonas xinjiangensis]
MSELCRYVLAGCFVASLVAWIALSAAYIIISVATHMYLTIFHKTFWKRFYAPMSFSLRAPRFGIKVDHFFITAGYEELKICQFRSFALWYGPVHALISEKLIPISFIAANACFITIMFLSAF